MLKRKIVEQIYWAGAIDWDRRLFDSLVPLPDGTSYNAYLVQGSEKTALLDTVDPEMTSVLMTHLDDLARLDYIVCHHVEQDHSGAMPAVLEKFPEAKVLISSKGKGMLQDHLHIAEDRLIVVKDGETVSLGDKTLEFLYTPWVHWPETMVTYLKEDKILFSCDFFGSHLATSDLFATEFDKVYHSAKLYYAEIMMPFRRFIQKNLEKLTSYAIHFIAPSHGPVYAKPQLILNAYQDWNSDALKNMVVIPYVSMHGSTKLMVEYLVRSLAEKGIAVQQYELATTDLGKLATALVDAATLIIGSPAVNNGPHPHAFNAAYVASILGAKFKHASVVGSYGWSSKSFNQISDLFVSMKVDLIEPVYAKGMPGAAEFDALDKMVAAIEEKHRAAGLMQ